MTQGVGFEPTCLAANGFQDRLVMTASITLRTLDYKINLTDIIIPHFFLFVNSFFACLSIVFYSDIPSKTFSKQFGKYMFGISILMPLILINRAV